MNKFVPGDVVKVITEKFSNGYTRTGVIGDSFYYAAADDGTMNKPGEDMYPCQWDDGTQGYRHVSKLEYA